MSYIKSLLAATLESVDHLQFPVLMSYKIDGFRASVQDGVLLTRGLNPVVNKWTQKSFARAALEGMDGELGFGTKPNVPNLFSLTSSAVTKVEGAPPMTFYVFDYMGVGAMEQGYETRIRWGQRRVKEFNEHQRWDPNECGKVNVKFLTQHLCRTVDQLLKFEAEAVDKGYEGIMTRSLDGRYKQGRSTLNEAILLKIKRFTDAEAIVVGVYEGETNTNAKDAKGKRTSHKAGKVKNGTLGGFLCVPLDCQCRHSIASFEECDHAFNLGTGTLSHAAAKALWERRGTLKGRIVKYKTQKHGTVNKPRIPVFLGFRDKSDL